MKWTVIVLDVDYGTMRKILDIDNRFITHIQEIETLHELGYIYPALTMALILPDICASYNHPEDVKHRGAGYRYMDWVNGHMSNAYQIPLPTTVTTDRNKDVKTDDDKCINDYFSLGNVIYGLRNSFAHSLSDEIGLSSEVQLDFEKHIGSTSDTDTDTDNDKKEKENKSRSIKLIFDVIEANKKWDKSYVVDPTLDINNYTSVFINIKVSSVYMGDYGLAGNVQLNRSQDVIRYNSLTIDIHLGAADLIRQLCGAARDYYVSLSDRDKLVMNGVLSSFVETNAYNNMRFGMD